MMTTLSKLIKICEAELLSPMPFLSKLLLAQKSELYFPAEDRKRYGNEPSLSYGECWRRNATFLLLILESEEYHG